jgi:hypothetical protein
MCCRNKGVIRHTLEHVADIEHEGVGYWRRGGKGTRLGRVFQLEPAALVLEQEGK